MTNIIRPVSILLCMLLAPACERQQVEQPEFGIAFKGKLTMERADELIEFLREGGNRRILLKANSAGGDSRAAMKLGDAMLNHDVTILVDKVCHSACSQYLLTSASKVIIKDGASVGFHWSPSTLQIPIEAPDIDKIELVTFREQEREFYLARNVDYAKLLDLYQHTKPLCKVIHATTFETTPLEKYGFLTQYMTVVPSRRLVEELRLFDFEGYWPRTQGEALASARKQGFDPKLTIAFAEELSPPKQLSRLLPCDPELVASASAN